ncbi:hypothetical protein SAMN02744778_01096 [Pantoea sp. GL120224-02]|nr:hypothetical protein SAMN02744778_01096 [Pantoea sp. GL120224-02]
MNFLKKVPPSEQHKRGSNRLFDESLVCRLLAPCIILGIVAQVAKQNSLLSDS